MDEMDLLPDELRRKSLYTNEIVLPFAEVMQAIDIFAEKGWAFAGWEPWILYPDGTYLHPVVHMDVDYRQAEESWGDFVQRSAQECSETIQEEQVARLNGTRPYYPASGILYFC